MAAAPVRFAGITRSNIPGRRATKTVVAAALLLVAADGDRREAGQIRPIEMFGRDFVLYRTRSGHAHVVGRCCPHQGASFQTGAVRGERLVCPFHHWEHEAGGCVRIPYTDRIPPRVGPTLIFGRLTVDDREQAIWRFMNPAHRRVLVADDALQQRFRRFYGDHLAPGLGPAAG